MKNYILLIIILLLIGGTGFVSAVWYYKPILEKKIEMEYKEKQQLTKVVVAAQDIMAGSIIQADQIREERIPFKNLVKPDKIVTDMSSVIGKVATVNIYTNEQIVVDKLGTLPVQPETKKIEFKKDGETVEPKDVEESDRYVTIDVPDYNLVNHRIKPGSYIDVLLDKGYGRYDIVLSKVIVYEMKEIGSGNSSKERKEMKRLKPDMPKEGMPLPGQETEKQNTGNPIIYNPNNLTYKETTDYRLTIRVNEFEYRRVFEAMACGKLMVREFVSPDQSPLTPTFYSVEEQKFRAMVTALKKKGYDYILRK